MKIIIYYLKNNIKIFFTLFLKNIYFIIGLLTFVIGIIALFIPIIPTIPFLIISIWAFSKFSPIFGNWIKNHPIYNYINKKIKRK